MHSFKLRDLLKPISAKLEEVYDVIVVGGGPAGLSAALYSARYQLRTVVVTKAVGGNAAIAPLVEDYLGVPSVTGAELVDKFVKHVEKHGVPIVIDEVVNVRKLDSLWVVETKSGRSLRGYCVILAIGSERNKLNVRGEEEFIGRGVSYCATCDGPLFKNKVVAVVGGGNAAFASALYLSTIASKVYIVHRRREFRAFRAYIDRAMNNPKIEIVVNSVVTEFIGEDVLKAIKIRNVETGEERIVEVDGVFVEIGSKPPTEFFRKIGVEVDEHGYALVRPDQSTNLPGIYVAGDSAGGPHKYRFEQIVTAAAEGAKAADAAFKYLLNLRERP